MAEPIKADRACSPGACPSDPDRSEFDSFVAAFVRRALYARIEQARGEERERERHEARALRLALATLAVLTLLGSLFLMGHGSR